MDTGKALISGSFSTGKTTLVLDIFKELKRRNHDVLYIPEVARSCPYPLNKEQTILTSTWLVSQQIKVEIEAAQKNPDLIICDRGIPDILSHAYSLKDKPDQEFKVMINLMKAWIHSYDVIFWSRIDDNISIAIDDSLRSQDENYRYELEDLISKAFDELDVNPIQLPFSLQKRRNMIVESLNRLNLITETKEI